MNPFISLGIPLVVALVAVGFTWAIWRDHASLTAAEMRKALDAIGVKRHAQVLEIIEEFDARYQSLRRDFTRLNAEVADMLDDAQRKVHRATMRDRRAREQANRNDEAQNGGRQVTEAQAWELEKSARITGRHGRG